MLPSAAMTPTLQEMLYAGSRRKHLLRRRPRDLAITPMRMLVITLVTIENEFEECVESIARQTYRDYQHIIFRDLGSMEANRALYGTFMERAGEFELLIRVDADMVIENPDLFAWVVEKMTLHPSLQILSIDIHDYFTNRLIAGLHTYRNTVKFVVDDPIQPDRPIVPKEHTRIERSAVGFGVRHCKNPSALQALHYGIHRGVKLREWARRRDMPRTYWYAWVIRQTWRNYVRRRDRRLGLALLGAELGVRGVFAVNHLSHHTELPKRVLGATEGLDNAAVAEVIRRLQRAAWGFLPAPLRAYALSWADVKPFGSRDLEALLGGTSLFPPSGET
jgi:hypothetical protein